jgi:hypothetical protein
MVLLSFLSHSQLAWSLVERAWFPSMLLLLVLADNRAELLNAPVGPVAAADRLLSPAHASAGTPATEPTAVDEAGVSSQPGNGAAEQAAAAAPAPAAARPELRCSVCGAATRPDGKRPCTCARCRAVTYCSEACQKEDWPAHKQQCSRVD